MNTDTPETDAVDAATEEVHAAFFMMRSHAWKLERERDEAREALKTGGLLDILDRAGHDRAEAIRERDEANIKLDLARVRADEAIQQTKELIELCRKQTP